MAATTVRELADQTKMPVERLLAQLTEAGVKVEDSDTPISVEDKNKWLEHLQGKPARSALGLGGGKGKMSLKRKEQTELKVTPGRGARTKTINVEVRKKRTFVKQAAEVEAPIPEAPVVEEEAAVSEPEAEATGQAQVPPVEAAEVVAEAVADSAPAETEETLAPVAVEASAVEPAVEEAAAVGAESEAPAAEETAPAEPVVDQDSASRLSSEPDHLRSEVSDLRRRVLENLRRAQEQESEIAKQKPAVPEKKKEARAPVRRKKDREELHVSAGKSGRRRKKSGKQIRVDTQHGFERPTAPVIREVELPDSISVGELAQRMAVKASEVIKTLMGMGAMATINESLDQDTAEMVVEEMGHTAKRVGDQDNEASLLQEAVSGGEVDVDEEPRPPVVTIMGHVDHGKTTLLDYIRETRVAAGESGGITQHIGAYHVATKRGGVTFLDTPGHAAFTRMRARGAAVTDIVILVVAADDGVMPQTKEAIAHARAAGVPIVVAMTKVDRENADIERVKNELSKEELIPEDWGGDTQFVSVSGITGEGVDDLLEALLLQAEVLELTAQVDAPAKGIVVESSLERGRGPVATMLIKSGTLKQADVILAGKFFGRVRAMFNESGQAIKIAGPSMPVQVLGLNGTPEAGDEAHVVSDERKAKDLAEVRAKKAREVRAKAMDRRSDWATSLGRKQAEELAVLLKCDVQGSSEALADSLSNLSTDEVTIKIVANGVGGISESDIDLASASRAMVIGFNTRADSVARRRAQEAGLELRYYSVIYDVINDVRDAASGLLGTETAEKIVGVALVRDVFRSSKFGAVAGCLVEEGNVLRGLPIRVLRDNVVIFEGELESLRRHKDDVNKVESGTECGIAVKNYNDVREGDRIEVFERHEVQRKLETAD